MYRGVTHPRIARISISKYTFDYMDGAMRARAPPVHVHSAKIRNYAPRARACIMARAVL